MDLVFKRSFKERRRPAMARRCVAALLVSISLGLSSKVCGQLAVELSAESQAAWRYNFSEADMSLLDEIQRGCFKYFWNEVGRPAMLARSVERLAERFEANSQELLTRLQVEKALAEDGVAVTTPAAVPTTAVFARESV